jgi:hypothetical protein
MYQGGGEAIGGESKEWHVIQQAFSFSRAISAIKE